MIRHKIRYCFENLSQISLKSILFLLHLSIIPEFMQFSNVVMVSHIGTGTAEVRIKMVLRASDNALKILK